MEVKFDIVKFYGVDVDEVPEASEEFELSKMPTYKFYKNGEEIYTIEGAEYELLDQKIEDLK